MKLPLLTLLLLCQTVFAKDTIQYARDCEEKIGIPVPSFSCDDSQATKLTSTRNGVAIPEFQDANTCDVPTHGADNSKCQTGTRILKFTDTITRVPGRPEKIETVVMCRRMKGDRGGSFSDMGVIQLNKTKNISCWFSSQSGQNSLNVPSPSSPGARNYWGSQQPNMNCLSCHDSSTWIRSPAFKITSEQGGYIRGPGELLYRRGGGNQIPDDDQKKGPSCAPDMPENPAPARQIRIMLGAYERRFGRSDATKAAPNSCTECHYIGTGGMGCDMALDSLSGRRGNPWSSRWAQQGVNSRWMPPQFSKPYWPSTFYNLQERRAVLAAAALDPNALAMAAIGEAVVDPIYARQATDYFEPARRAIAYCCGANADPQICGGRFIQTPADACWALAPAPARGGAPIGRGRTH